MSRETNMTCGYALVLMAALCAALVCTAMPTVAMQAPLDLRGAVIVVRHGADAPPVERTAATVLAEEIESRTGIRWRVATDWPKSGWAVGIISGSAPSLHGRRPPERAVPAAAEGFAVITHMSAAQRPVVWIVGADPRGALFGVGKLLRILEMRRGVIESAAPLDIKEAPVRAIRGHQLGYRATANSYDAWMPEQYDRYIRELALFGTNAIENIPGQDERPTVSSFPRSKMNVEISRICGKYGLDHWIWTPASFDLKDGARRTAALDYYEKLYKELPVLTDVFVPGGDPGPTIPTW